MKRRLLLQGILILPSIWTGLVFGQNQLKFSSENATAEGAIQLHWASTNHELYQIQYANALATNDDGSTAWQVLYDNYPSHGTNTFIGDFGNYDVDPAVPHPKYAPSRFYRVVDIGADNDIADVPVISITSPTSNSVLTGPITVSVSATCSNLPITTTKLYVDGQEMNPSDDGTNYVVNTPEWPNGPHVLYAVATARSGLSGPSGSFPISTSHHVSSYMPVTFSNLITSIAFSQPFFEPSLGQTQEVTAVFAANCNWTLQIQDMDSSNIVRTVTGSGGSMVFDWNGTGNGGTNIADGNYSYLISVLTNGLPLPQIQPSTNQPPPPPPPGQAMMSSSTIDGTVSTDAHPTSPKEAFSLGLDYYYPQWPPMPPVRVNGQWVPWEDVYGPVGAVKIELSDAALGTMLANSLTAQTTANASSVHAQYSGASSQSALAPTRPPTSPMKNSLGTFGVAYIDWATSQTVSIPKNGIPFPATGVCHLDTGGSTIQFDKLPEGPGFEVNFIRTMKKGGWKLTYDKSARSTPALHANDMRRSDQGYGGSELFTTANIGLFMDHGNYGTDPDYSAGSSGSMQTYFRISTDSGDNGWLRMCQIGFGGDLKWLGVLACNSLTTYSSMLSAGAIPLKTTHMVCGMAAVGGVGEEFGEYWAKKMLGGVFKTREKISNAWFDAGHDQYQGATNLTGTITFRVAGYPECMNDTIKNNVAPTNPSSAPGNLTKVDQQVYP